MNVSVLTWFRLLNNKFWRNETLKISRCFLLQFKLAQFQLQELFLFLMSFSFSEIQSTDWTLRGSVSSWTLRMCSAKATTKMAANIRTKQIGISKFLTFFHPYIGCPCFNFDFEKASVIFCYQKSCILGKMNEWITLKHDNTLNFESIEWGYSMKSVPHWGPLEFFRDYLQESLEFFRGVHQFVEIRQGFFNLGQKYLSSRYFSESIITKKSFSIAKEF